MAVVARFIVHTNAAIIIIIIITVSINSLGRIPSTLGDLLSFTAFIFYLPFLELQLTALNSLIQPPGI